MLEGNQSDFSATAGSKESQAEGWKKGKERKSATPGGDFFSQAFPPIQHIQRHVGLGEIGVFLAGAQSCFKEQTDCAV